jgi:hypothetical protein
MNFRCQWLYVLFNKKILCFSLWFLDVHMICRYVGLSIFCPRYVVLVSVRMPELAVTFSGCDAVCNIFSCNVQSSTEVASYVVLRWATFIEIDVPISTMLKCGGCFRVLTKKNYEKFTKNTKWKTNDNLVWNVGGASPAFTNTDDDARVPEDDLKKSNTKVLRNKIHFHLLCNLLRANKHSYNLSGWCCWLLIWISVFRHLNYSLILFIPCF